MKSRAVWLVAGGVLGCGLLADATWGAFERQRILGLLRGQFISEDLQEAVTNIQRIYSTLICDIKTNGTGDRHPFLVNILLLNTIHEKEATTLGGIGAYKVRQNGSQSKKRKLSCTHRRKPCVKETLVTDAARYMLFASSAYGLLLLKGLNILPKEAGWPPLHKLSSAELDRWCVQKHTGVADTDLRKVSLADQPSLHLPGHFLAVDHATKSVVLSVRGTWSLQDALTDLQADTVDFLGGKAHKGIAQSAAILWSECGDQVKEELLQHPGYRLVITGHSLGGGTAILLSLMLLSAASPVGVNVPVECFAFAPPPVFGPLAAAPRAAAKHVHSFVYRNDLVPRLSLANALSLLTALKEVDELPATLRQRFSYIVKEMRPTVSVEDDGLGTVGVRIGLRYANKVKEGGWMIGDSDHPISEHLEDIMGKEGECMAGAGESAAMLYDCLNIPGQVLYLNKLGEECNKETLAKEYGILCRQKEGGPAFTLEDVDPATFDKILVTDSMLVDHWPRWYENALQGLLDEEESPRAVNGQAAQ
ncbi:unnamed protein product [Chrysoparadoxa australica]